MAANKVIFLRVFDCLGKKSFLLYGCKCLVGKKPWCNFNKRENSNDSWGPRGWVIPDGAGTAGVDQGRGPSIRSSSGGQDEAIATSNVLLGALVVLAQGHTTAI